MNNFFSHLDSRILELDFSKLVDFTYLTEMNPGDFNYLHWGVFLGVLAAIIGSLIYRLLKRPRKRFSVGSRMALRSGGLRQVALAMGLLIYLLFRSINTPFISMRLWLVLLILGGVINIFFTVWKSIQHKGEQKEKVTTSVQGYQQYLPKKKKKK